MKRLLLILLSINLFTLAFGQSLTVKGKVPMVNYFRE